ncbi:MAG: LysM peptidoglycan-binding domain-containing protein [Tepidiformaceae bacterium]
MNTEEQETKGAESPLRGRVYWGAILTLFVGTLVTIFLLLTPPKNESDGLLVLESSDPEETPTEQANVSPSPTATPTPTPISTPTLASTPEATPTPTPTPTPMIEHTVLDGETISGIATRYGVTTQQIMELNPSLDPNLIFTGEVILIPTNVE